MKMLARGRSVGTESGRVDTFRNELDRAAELAGQMLRSPPVGHERVRVLQITAVSDVRLAGQVDDDRYVAHAKTRRLMQRVCVHEVGLSWARRNAPPGGPTEPLFVRMQRGHRQASEPTTMLMAVHEVARVGRSQQLDREVVGPVARSTQQQRTS